MDYIIREIKKAEYDLLNDFLYEAIYIPDGVEPPPKSIINCPELQEYVFEFGKRKDDRALVAEVQGNVIGAIWVRIMNDYGHIDNDTPSLAMSVFQKYRGQGIGTSLLQQLLLVEKTSGYSKLSLSVQKNNYAQLLPSELFEQIEKQSVVVTPVYVKSDAMQQAKKLSATASTSSSTKTSSTKKNTADKTSKPIAVREVKVAKQETAATAPAVKSPESANHPFHIIVAGGISLKDAEAIATQLKSKGFANAKALNMDGKVRVSISSFDNRNEATKQLLELRKNETYKNAWLLAK